MQKEGMETGNSVQEQRKERTIYTIGHSNHTLDHFLNLLRKHGIEVVVDVRSQPYSHYVPHFNQEKLKQVLPQNGVRYLYLGKELGGRPRGAEFYDEDGKVNYSRLAESEPFKQGIARLIQELPRSRVALMCGEENPTMCHRRLLVGRALAAQGITVYHIRGDGRIETDDQLEAEKKVEDCKVQQLLLLPRAANGQSMLSSRSKRALNSF